jgi:hypothetical protein
MTTHTPGPWTIEHQWNGLVRIQTPHTVVATVEKIHGTIDGDMADAKLIAAAPELLEALQGVVSHNVALKDAHKISPALMRHVSAAIAKATT